MRLKTRIHLFSTLLMLLILIITSTAIYFTFKNLAYKTEYNQLNVNAEELTETLSQATEQVDPVQVLRAYLPPHSGIRIIDGTGAVRIAVQNVTGLESYHSEKPKHGSYSIGTFENTPVLSLREPVIWTNGEVLELEMVQLLVDVKHNLQTLVFILSGVLLVAMVLITVSSIALVRVITQPVEKLIHTMARIQKDGKYEQIQVSSDGKDEMSQMGRTFNDMMMQLERNFNQQEEFVSNASHELKTPLTVIESYARLLKRQGFDNREIAEEAVQAILGESNRMKEMIEQLLHLARSHEQFVVSITNTNVYEQVERTLQPLRQAYGRDYTIEGTDSLDIETDPEVLRQLLFILLDNARKYSDKEIKTVLTETETTVVISVIDYGNGIPEDSLPELFNRFYRVEEDRNRKTGGTGLGLAIAKELAMGIGAELSVESIVGMGTTFRLVLPKKQLLTEF
ncbi:sensor histidine kinase [Sporosarcina sp. CAU 1771]